MGKKEKGPTPKRVIEDIENPFSKIVLKEKKEEKKIDRSGKKPGEIVHGYNPSLSFGDILSSYEKTGNPYSMPKKRSSSPSSFGDILEEWENGSKKNKKKSNSESKGKLSSYKASRSFASILNDYEAEFRKKETKKVKGEAKGKIDEQLKNASFVEEEKKEKRISRESLSPLNKSPIENKTKIEEIKEETFFITDDETEVPDEVSWSIIGGKNENFVRKEENKESTEEKKEKKKTSSSSHYTPSRSFDEILYSFDKKKSKKDNTLEEEKPIEKEDVSTLIEDPFFIQDEKEVVPPTVSWSILGGTNKSFKREEAKKEEAKETKRSSSSYTPSSSFSSILSSYEKNNVKEKTFSEIIKEKGDNRKKKSSLTINELRRMNVQAILDLHGETQKDSRDMIASFLSDSVKNGLRKVSIITGKGLHSESGNSVIRELALEELNSSSFVSEISSAPLSKGGSGALWVILKEKTE